MRRCRGNVPGSMTLSGTPSVPDSAFPGRSLGTSNRSAIKHRFAERTTTILLARFYVSGCVKPRALGSETFFLALPSGRFLTSFYPCGAKAIT
jgi:hypothetical protein